MENASKALIIAGAILLSIAIIGIGMFVYQSVSGTIQDATDMSQQEIDAYNQPYENYKGNIRGSAAKQLCNNIRSHNLQADDDSQKIGVFTSDKGTEYAAGNTEGTSTTEINKVSNDLQSGKTYTVSFGYDKSSGLVTAVYIVEVKD